MAKTRDKVYDAAENIKPYVERAMADEKLRGDVLRAFATASELYGELIGGRGAVRSPRASRPTTTSATSSGTRSTTSAARATASRARRSTTRRNTTLLIAGIALGILFNPVTGPETRRFIKDMLGGGDDEFGGDYPSSTNGGTTS